MKNNKDAVYYDRELMEYVLSELAYHLSTSTCDLNIQDRNLFLDVMTQENVHLKNTSQANKTTI